MSNPLGNWIDLSAVSNLYIQTYVKGFVDMSGGNLILRNNSIYVNSGDLSLGGRLLTIGDASLGGNLYVGKKLTVNGDVSMNGNLVVYGNLMVQTASNTNIINTTVNNYQLVVIDDISLNGRLLVSNDVSFGGNLYVKNNLNIAGTILANSYIANNHSIGPPAGSVMSFIGGGTTISGTNPSDPDGWVICDGQNRTASDSRFANLATILNTYLGVGTNTANSITPPNLQGRFLQGPTSAATATQSTGGAATVTLTAAQIPPLPSTTGTTGGIKITDPGHVHTQTVGAAAGGGGAAISYSNTGNGQYQGGAYNTLGASTGVTAAYLNTAQTTVPTVPPYTTMNYIMKY
jgi:microcystin-dependent protein/cytoskeletal protein CcmA (bactofilin family)